MSTLNHAEVGLVIALFRELTSRFSSLRGGGRIAVISPYKAQVLDAGINSSMPSKLRSLV